MTWKDAEAALDAAVAAHPLPWFRVADGRETFTIPDDRHVVARLMDAAGEAGVPFWLLGQAAAVIADARGCELREAWDRLAHNLEQQVLCSLPDWWPV